MASAGFCYTYFDNILINFYCAIEVFEQLSTSSPIEEHLHHSTNCDYAKMEEVFGKSGIRGDFFSRLETIIEEER